MRRLDLAGTALPLLCLPIALAAIAACSRPQPPVQKMSASPEELRANIQAIQAHPSLEPGSNEAGDPIHVDPYPHSAGMSHHDEAPHGEPHHETR